MNKDSFQSWKENNEWFWSYLRDISGLFDEGLDRIGRQMVSPNVDKNQCQVQAIELQARIDLIDEICELKYENVVEVNDDTPTA